MSVLAALSYSYLGGNINVSLVVTDTTTGLPANGGNLFVKYSQDLGAGVSIHIVSVPGQSLLIYSGTYTGNEVFAIRLQNQIGTPPSVQCDLVINTITVNTPESGIGSNDAQITVSASSSYNIQYSIDNITFQSSPIFSGLGGGLKTVYCTDSNAMGCAVNASVTISILQNLLLSDPSVNVGGNISRWSACFNPIVFKYQRKDYEVQSVVSLNGGVNIGVNISGALSLTPGEMVYLNAGTYVGTFTVLASTVSGYTLAVAFAGNATGYTNINSQRKYYKIVTKLQSGNVTMLCNNSSTYPGLVVNDVKSFLKTLVGVALPDSSNYTAINYLDNQLSAAYTVQFAETWQNPDGTQYKSAWVSLPNTYHVTFTARQIQQAYGGNMVEYVPFITQPAKWVTDFVNPVYSIGYPFDLSFLIGEEMAGLNLYARIVLQDINQHPIPGNEIDSYLLAEDGTYILQEDGGRIIIQSVTLGNISLVNQVGLNRLLINLPLQDEVYFMQVGVYYNNGTSEVALVRPIEVRVDKQTCEQSVYFRWIGLTGSWNYYRFVYNQEVTLDVQNAVIITDYITDYANAEGVERVIAKNAGQKMQVHATDMSVQDIKDIQPIKYSPKVQIREGNKWKTVVVNTASFNELETLLGTYEFAFTFNYPSYLIQTQ